MAKAKSPAKKVMAYSVKAGKKVQMMHPVAEYVLVGKKKSKKYMLSGVSAAGDKLSAFVSEADARHFGTPKLHKMSAAAKKAKAAKKAAKGSRCKRGLRTVEYDGKKACVPRKLSAMTKAQLMKMSVPDRKSVV